MMPTDGNRLLVIDDETDIGELVGDVAREMGFETRIADAPEGFWSHYGDFSPSVVVLDLMMPEADGVELLRELSRMRCEAGIVLMSGADERVLNTARRLGESHGLKMLGTLNKPVRIADLEGVLSNALRADPKITEADLAAAIENDEIVVHYQPKVSLAPEGQPGDGWSVIGAEALARCNHPRLGLLGPDRFIPLAESSGLIGPMTENVLRRAVGQLAEWNGGGRQLTMAVNLAPQLLNDLDLPDRVARLMAEHGVPPHRLTLEITESGAMADAARTMDILTRFRLKGFGLSIDDFGTGYSSLVQLHRMPFNEMKIDKSFVLEFGANAEAKPIIESIAGLGHAIGLTLCAEGVENVKALNFLRSLGCELAQGYFIAKPLPPEKFVRFVDDSGRRPEA